MNYRLKISGLMAGLIVWTLTAHSAEPGTWAHYLSLTARHGVAPPFAALDFLYGPKEKIAGQSGLWWQMALKTAENTNQVPQFVLRCFTSADPLAEKHGSLKFIRYQLKILNTGEVLDYRDAHTGLPLLPAWFDFERYFIPHRSSASHTQNAVPETCELLGHVLTLGQIAKQHLWEPWPQAKILALDRELLVGTGRPFKDQEGHRLPQKPTRQNYTYVPFQAADYSVMIAAGINLFTVQPGQEQWVRSEPVFYLRGVSGNPLLRYPVDLYRANYLGSVMFMDEPTILITGDSHVNKTLQYFSDAAALIEKRTRSTYLGAGSYGAFALEKSLQDKGVNFGDMRLMQADYPSWETIYETAFYQFAGGARGIVHEGRYQLAPFEKAVAKWTGVSRRYTANEMIRYHYAFLRGAARHFAGFWGSSIYGQADPAISPEAVKLAYDMGARYVWFWTSDHDHHVPWPEQLELARTLRAHVREHPRASIYSSPPKLDTAIVIPAGYFLSLDDLWWVRVLDKEGKNQASQQYRRLMQRALKAVDDCLKRNAEFDILPDDTKPIKGYRRVVRISNQE